MRRTWQVLGGALTATLLIGCGSDGLDGGYSVEGALAELPAVGDDALLAVSTADLEGAGELADAPAAADDPEGWFAAMVGSPVSVVLTASLREGRLGAEDDGGLGFALDDVRSYAEVIAGSDRIEVYRLEAADDLDEDDGSLTREVDGDLVGLSPDAELLEDWTGREESLADDETLAAVARALDDEEVYAAQLLRLSETPSPQGGDEPGRVPAFSAVGIGQQVLDGEPGQVVAYRVDGDDPEQAAAAVEEAWRASPQVEDGLAEVTSVDLVGDDVVVVALAPERADFALQLLAQRSPLFLS